MDYKWKDISYLLDGNTKQKKAYKILNELKVFDVLQGYNPILVGTIPINIDIENSDLDIICEVYDFDEFENIIKDKFDKMKKFKLYKEVNDKSVIISANFIYDEFIIEIFGQGLPTTMQNGYKHMLIENRILNICGEDFRDEILNLKKAGIKTEPAFAKCLNIQGNPYDELLKLDNLSNQEILQLLSR